MERIRIGVLRIVCALHMCVYVFIRFHIDKRTIYTHIANVYACGGGVAIVVQI